MAIDYQKIRKHVFTRAKKMFAAFDRRKDILLEVAREWYPLGVPGLELGVEQIADGWKFDDEHRMLTTLPLQLLRKSASGFLSNMMSPARPWFDFQLSGGSNADHDQLLALANFKNQTQTAFQRSNAYVQGYKLFEHLLWAGFGCMIVSETDNGGVNCQTLRIGTYALDIDDSTGRVNRVARRFAWTADKILEVFTQEWTPEYVKEMAKRGDTKRIEIWNLIEPNPHGFSRKFDPLEKDGDDIFDESLAYRSVYLVKGAGSKDRRGGEKFGLLKLTGFRHNPIIAPRLDYEQGDVYGIGRCMDGNYQAKGAQTFKGDELRIEGIRAQQPVVATPDLKNRIQLGRKGITIVKSGDQVKDRVVPVFSNLPDSDDARKNYAETKAELESLLFVDAFAVIDAQKNNPGVKTATEIEYLKTENLGKLGAIYINLSGEMFDPLVKTLASYAYDGPGVSENDKKILQESGILNGFEVEYVSQIALAQKAGALSSVQQYIQFCGNLAAMKPNAIDNPIDNLDTDKTLRMVGRMLNVPEDVNKDEKEINKTRAALAERIANQQRAAQEAQFVEAAKSIGAIPVDKAHVGGMIAEGLK